MISDFINFDGVVCDYIPGPIPQATSAVYESYTCTKCTNKTIGSFVTLQLQDPNKIIGLHDFQVEGNFIKKRGNHLK